tara:strand:+ start:4395 stop:4682 length:288 start_codon:yes stop_codon:yes gene_type:complete
MKNRIIDGYHFEYVANDQDTYYQCRGEICYDSDHDQVPEEALWKACIKLEKQLQSEGYKAEADYSEKGWVEVNIEPLLDNLFVGTTPKDINFKIR